MRHKERLELAWVKEQGARRPLKCRSCLSPLWLSWLYGWLVKLLLRTLRCMSFPEPEGRGGVGIPTPGGGSGMPPATAPCRAGGGAGSMFPAFPGRKAAGRAGKHEAVPLLVSSSSFFSLSICSRNKNMQNVLAFSSCSVSQSKKGTLLKHLPNELAYCAGFGWDRVNFLHSS